MTDNATPSAVRNHIPMDYLERHPGDLEAAMRDYAEDRWKLIDRLKESQDAREALLSALEKAAVRFEAVRARIYRLGPNPGMKALELADYTRQCEAEIDAAIASAKQ